MFNQHSHLESGESTFIERKTLILLDLTYLLVDSEGDRHSHKRESVNTEEVHVRKFDIFGQYTVHSI